MLFAFELYINWRITVSIRIFRNVFTIDDNNELLEHQSAY